MNVTLISCTQFPLDTLFIALSQCYNSPFILEDVKNTPKEKKAKILYNVLKSGHTSISEHVSFTFLIEGISRIVSHELVRHRLASYTQQSTRYCDVTNNPEWAYVPNMSDNEDTYKVIHTLDTIKENYTDLLNNEEPRENVRYLLPNGTTTNIVVTMNCRSLQNFFGQRLCKRAAPEIQELARKMAEICKDVFPEVFVNCNFAEPKCIQNGGYCKEGKGCGLCPRFERNIDKVKYSIKENILYVRISGKKYEFKDVVWDNGCHMELKNRTLTCTSGETIYLTPLEECKIVKDLNMSDSILK